MPRTFAQGCAFLIGFLIALYLSPMIVKLSRADGPPLDESAQRAQLEVALLAEVNELRQRFHLIPLQRAEDLDGVARGHSDDMARRNFMSHVTPEGANPVDRMHRAGVGGFTLAAENLGRTDVLSAPAREIVRAWLESSAHRENLLAPHFNTTGIGVTRAPDGGLLFTQVYVTYPR